MTFNKFISNLPDKATLILRGFQVFFALLSFSCVFGGYKCSITMFSNGEQSGTLYPNLQSDNQINFLGVTGILIFIFGIFYIIAIEIKKISLPNPYVGMIYDGTACCFTLAASIAVGQSKVVLNVCSSNLNLNCGLNCDAIKTAIAFTVFNFILFVVTMGLSIMEYNQQIGKEHSLSPNSENIPYAVAGELTPRTPVAVEVKPNGDYVLNETPKVAISTIP